MSIENFLKSEVLDKFQLEQLKNLSESHKISNSELNNLIKHFYKTDLEVCKILFLNKDLNINNSKEYMNYFLDSDNLEGMKIFSTRCKKLHFYFQKSIKNHFNDIFEFLFDTMIERESGNLDTSLIVAIENDNFFAAEKFVSKGIKSEKSLHFCKSARMCNLFLYDGNYDFIFGSDTPLIKSIRSNFQEVFDILLPYCDVNKTVNEYNNALSTALRSKNKHYINSLIRLKNIELNVVSGTDNNPLLIAIKLNNYEFIDLVLEDPNFDYNYGVDIITNPVYCLLKNKKDLAVDKIFKSRKFDFERFNELRNSRETILHLIVSSYRDFSYVFEEIIDYSKVNIEKKDTQGRSVFHLCLSLNKIRYANILLNKTKIDFNSKDNIGSTPLITAAEIGNNEMISKLLNFGVDPNIFSASRIVDSYKSALTITLKNGVVHRDLIMKTNFNNFLLINWINRNKNFNFEIDEDIIKIISDKVNETPIEDFRNFSKYIFLEPLIYNDSMESENIGIRKIVNIFREKLGK